MCGCRGPLGRSLTGAHRARTLVGEFDLRKLAPVCHHNFICLSRVCVRARRAADNGQLNELIGTETADKALERILIKPGQKRDPKAGGQNERRRAGDLGARPMILRDRLARAPIARLLPVCARARARAVHCVSMRAHARAHTRAHTQCPMRTTICIHLESTTPSGIQIS